MLRIWKNRQCCTVAQTGCAGHEYANVTHENLTFDEGVSINSLTHTTIRNHAMHPTYYSIRLHHWILHLVHRSGAVLKAAQSRPMCPPYENLKINVA